MCVFHFTIIKQVTPFPAINMPMQQVETRRVLNFFEPTLCFLVDPIGEGRLVSAIVVIAVQRTASRRKRRKRVHPSRNSAAVRSVGLVTARAAGLFHPNGDKTSF